ncbi:MAG: IS630 family transposase [Actinobacteria bacterium]|nr:IS630 family transposase [Actinomycetota bacterium]
MRENDGRKLDHKTLEDIRIRSVRLIMDEQVRIQDVAESLGLRRSTVYSWVKTYKEHGAQALLAKPIPGRPSKLSDEQVRAVYTILLGKDPRQLQFDFALWTRWMVRDLIKRMYDVELTEQSVGRMLRRLGMSPQRPLVRAYEQDPEAVRRWKTETYPAIREQAVQVGATIYFGDEAGIRSDYHTGTTWAPVGRTPVVRSTGKRHSVNMLSAVTAQGGLHFMLHEESVDSSVFIEFCRRLLHDDGGTVFLIVDNHSTHLSNETRAFVASTDGQLRLFFLPTYSPELNPDEWVWKNVKHDRIGRSGITGAADLYTKATRALQRLQDLPGIVRGFFADPDLRYIHA